MKENKRFEYIDSLRGVAILLVILVHTSQTIDSLSYFISRSAKFGQMGVQLFFVLSALTLCFSIEKKKISSRELLRFYLRRFFRIAPLYYCGILLYSSFNIYYNYSTNNAIQISEPYTVKAILANVFLLHGMVPEANNSIVPGGWSIGTEMVFYGIFPFLFLLYRNVSLLKGFIISLLFTILCYLGIHIVSFYFEIDLDNHTFIYYNLLNMLPVFIIGIIYYKYLKVEKPFLGKENRKKMLLTSFAAGAAAFLHFIYFFDVTLTPIIAAIFFITLIEIFKNFTFLNFNWLQRIGQLSFSIYVFHFVFAWHVSKIIQQNILTFAAPEVQLLICLSITIIGSICIALFTEKIIERNGIRIGSYVINKIRKPNS